MNKIITFGEVMGRLNAQGNLRLMQCCPGSLDFTFAGAEANVAASISILGGQSVFVTVLPDNSIADACVANLKSVGVDTRYMVKKQKGRLGLFYLESGANQRPSNVIYDREYSAISLTKASEYPWTEIFEGGRWFHVSGITPAISENAAAATLLAVKKAKESGLTVSFDLNFRKKLWRWDESIAPRDLAEKTIRQILPCTDLVIGNEEDASDVLGIFAGDTDVYAGKLEIDKYPEVARKIIDQFPNITRVAITLRESISATHNKWGAMLYDAPSSQSYFAPIINDVYEPYQIKNIVDRVGGGDSFAAGLIFALTTQKFCDPIVAIAFAAASSCLAHSIQGDFNYSTRQEVESLMKGSGSGRVVR